MGKGKIHGNKNKKGSGRLHKALQSAQSQSLTRAKELAAQQALEARAAANKPGAKEKARKEKRKRLEEEREVKRRRIELEGDGESGDEDEEVGEVENEVDGEREIRMQVKRESKKARDAERTTRRRKRGELPYGLNERILLVGEGNFSFAHSLLLFSPPLITPSLLLATSNDTESQALEKYPDVMGHVNALREGGARILFGVDATALGKVKEVKEWAVGEGQGWDRVAFNFPHVGLGITDQNRNIRANQILLLNFARSVFPILRKGPPTSSLPTGKKMKKSKTGKLPKGKGKDGKKAHKRHSDSSDSDSDAPADDNSDSENEDDLSTSLHPLFSGPKPSGKVLLTLRTASPYSLWSASSLFTRGPLLAPSLLPRPLPSQAQPSYKVVRSMEFRLDDWMGYEHRRTGGWRAGGEGEGGNVDLKLTARERKERRLLGEGGVAGGGEEKAGEGGASEERKGKGSGMRTWEFERVEPEDEDDVYDRLG